MLVFVDKRMLQNLNNRVRSAPIRLHFLLYISNQLSENSPYSLYYPLRPPCLRASALPYYIPSPACPTDSPRPLLSVKALQQEVEETGGKEDGEEGGKTVS